MRVLAAVFLWMASIFPAFAYDVAEKDIATLEADMRTGRVTSVQLVQAYLDRIAAFDRAGPQLNSVIAINPDALAAAAALDAERKAGHVRGPLHGIPILVKDNIETADPIPTTAGSLALTGNITHRDAPAVARLRAAGAVILGKTNLSEWANIRSNFSISGWSAIGGLVKNPYVLDRSACGSSSGSGAAVAASLAAAALGTETNGSLVCPASFNGLVSIKPTVGLVSRTHVVPISHTQDTPGPMTRSVRDAALLLQTMSGSDPADPATAGAGDSHVDFGASLGDGATLTGRRLGLIVPPDASPAGQLFAQALERLKAAGAEIVLVKDFKRPDGIGEDEDLVLKTELKADMAVYLQSLPGNGPKTLADLIAFNKTSPRELALFGQDLFEQADQTKGLNDPAYRAALTRMQAAARKLLNDTLTAGKLDALIQATDDPAFRVDFAKGDNDSSTASGMPAMAGYPHLTVPMGMVKGLPVGLSFMGPAWSEGRLLGMGAAAEKVLPPRQPPQFVPTLEATPAAALITAPYRAP
jgi:amidase